MKFCIDGQHRLRGELPVYGAKNCVLALLGATVLTDEDVVLRNAVAKTYRLYARVAKHIAREHSHRVSVV